MSRHSRLVAFFLAIFTAALIFGATPAHADDARPVWWREPQTPKRKPLTLRRTLARTVIGNLCALAGFAGYFALMACGVIPTNMSQDHATPDSATVTQAQKIDRLSVKYGCDPEGFGQTVIPVHALIELRGDIKVVTFDRGWASLKGDKPGRLISVCRK